MSNSLLNLNPTVTSVAILTPVALGGTPLLGSPGATNGGRKCNLRVPTLPGAAVIAVQTAPRVDPATNLEPASGSSLWTTMTTINSSSHQEQEVTPDYWVRCNVTTLQASPATVDIFLEGVQ